jgi:hypothetical protein
MSRRRRRRTIPIRARPRPTTRCSRPTAPTARRGEEIVVTGLRRSLESSQNIKRNSDQIVDVIVAEDIGKLPDRTVSEALTRIPA